MEIFEEFFSSGLGNVLQGLGILATLVISLFALVSNRRLVKKGAYIAEITPLREKYIQNLRQHVSEFASAALELNRATWDDDATDTVWKRQLIRELDLKHGQTSLFLNEENAIDKHLANYLLAVRMSSRSKGNDGMLIEDTIRRMLLYTQQVLIFEWQNLKYEATNGPMDPSEIQLKRKEFLDEKKSYYIQSNI